MPKVTLYYVSSSGIENVLSELRRSGFHICFRRLDFLKALAERPSKIALVFPEADACVDELESIVDYIIKLVKEHNMQVAVVTTCAHMLLMTYKLVKAGISPGDIKVYDATGEKLQECEIDEEGFLLSVPRALAKLEIKLWKDYLYRKAEKQH